MGRRITPDEMIDAEIERLKKSEEVKLAKKEQRLLMNKKRKYLADLRWLEKRGRTLMEEGWTYDTLDLLYREDD